MNFTKILIAIVILVQVAVAYMVYNVYDKINQVTISVESTKDILFSTTGKIEKLENLTKATTAAIKNTAGSATTIQYIEKEIDQFGEKEATDIQLKTNPADINIKINDGTIYNLKALPNETSKFENGKLILENSYSSSISIKAPKRSKLQASALMNSDKDVMGIISYDLNDTFSATFAAGQGIKPYYGISFKVGNY